MQARWSAEDIDFAKDLADVVLGHFEDREGGGFFFTADDHEKLFHRHKPMADEAMPSGNGIAAQTLIRLGRMLGESRYLDAAERCLNATWPYISELPYAHDSLLVALEEWINPPQLIVIRGRPEAMRAWQDYIDENYMPRRMAVAIATGISDLPGMLTHCVTTGELVAYVCSGTRCSEPAKSLTELESLLAG